MDNPPEHINEPNCAHCAWIDSLSPDETLILHTPCGHCHNLIYIALAKSALLTPGIKPAEQLRILEAMNSIARFSFGCDADQIVAMVTPMGDTEYQIFKAAKSLDPPGDKSGNASFNVLTSWRVFNHFLKLNPSLFAAIKLREESRRAGASLGTVDAADGTTERQQPQAGNVPTTYAGPTSDSRIPDRFWPQPVRNNFAIGSPGHAGGPIDPHTGQ